MQQGEAVAASLIRHFGCPGSHRHACHRHHVPGHGLQCGHEQQAKQCAGGIAHSLQLCGDQRCVQLAEC